MSARGRAAPGSRSWSGAGAFSSPSRCSRAGGVSTSIGRSPACTPARATSCWSRPTARAPGRRVVGLIGRPDVAQDVLEALMVDAGSAVRSTRRSSVRPAWPRERAPHDAPRKDLRELPTFTIDPPTARDFDDAISAERLDRRRRSASGSHRGRRRLRAAGLGRRPRGIPARDQRLRPRQGRADVPEALSNQACSLVPHRTGSRSRSSRLPGRRGRAHASTARDPLGRAPDYPQVDRVFGGDDRARSVAARRGGAGPRTALARGAPGAARSRSSRSSRSSTSPTRGT